MHFHGPSQLSSTDLPTHASHASTPLETPLPPTPPRPHPRPIPGGPPDLERWRWAIEARSTALRTAIAAGDGHDDPDGVATAAHLADEVTALVRRARVELGEAVAVHRAAVHADLAVAAWAELDGDAVAATGALHRAAAAIYRAEAAFPTPVTWERLRAALTQT